MHEKFQEEMERQGRRLDDRIFQPPAVRCLADIKRLLVELDPRSAIAQSTPISSDMVAEDETGAIVSYRVSARTDVHNKRTIIINGFAAIKSRMELEKRAAIDIKTVMVNGREMAPTIRPAALARAWVDPLLQRWFSATRDGLRMRWVVQEGTFMYDPFEHRLFKVH